MANFHRRKARGEPARLFVERLKSFILHAVFAVHLLHDQFAVAIDAKAMLAAQAGRVFQGADKGGVLGLIVRAFADTAGFLDGRLPIALNHISERRWAGIATRAAVRVNSQDAWLTHHRLAFGPQLCRILGAAARRRQRLLEQPCALIVNGVATAIEPRILLVETSGRAGQIALALGDAMLAVRTLDEARRHARDLAPALAAMLTEQKWKAHDLDAVFVSRGPGSYTGLRVGIMSAKMLAYATGCALFGIQTFAAITAQAPVDAERLDILADAQQGKVYVQSFQRADGAIWLSVSQLAVRRFNDWLASRDPSAWVSGPALAIYGRSLPQNVRMVPEADWNPRAQSLLAPGLPRYRAGERDDPWTLEPLYLRPSAAEEQWNKVGKHDSVGRLS